MKYIIHSDGCTINGLVYNFNSNLSVEEQIVYHSSHYTKEYVNKHLKNIEAIKEAFKRAYIQTKILPVVKFCKKYDIDLKQVLSEIDLEEILES